MRGMRFARAGRNPASSDCGSALRPVRVRGAACHATARHHAEIARRTPMTRTCASKLRDEGERPAGLGLCKASSSSGVISAAPATLLSSEPAACTRTRRVSVPAVCQCCDSAESRGRVPAAALALSASPGQPSVPPCCRRSPWVGAAPRISSAHLGPGSGPRSCPDFDFFFLEGVREKPSLQIEGTHREKQTQTGRRARRRFQRPALGQQWQQRRGTPLRGCLRPPAWPQSARQVRPCIFCPHARHAHSAAPRVRMCMPHARTHELGTCSRTR